MTSSVTKNAVTAGSLLNVRVDSDDELILTDKNDGGEEHGTKNYEHD